MKLLLIIPLLATAISFSDIKEKALSFIKPYISSDKSEKKQTIAFPKIPKLENSATDIEILKNTVDDSKKKYTLLDLSEKRKYRIAFLQELYLYVVNENISDNQLSIYLNRLEQGAKREGIYRSLVADQNYAQLENLPTLPSKELINFFTSFSKKYLSLSYQKDAVANMNSFSLKRILTDKSLDIFDALLKSPNEAYAWYAHLSAFVADKTAWKQKIRSQKDIETHYRWAKSNPVNLIKSEIILKMNKLINSI